MSTIHIIGIILATGIFVYLGVVLLFPEKFT